MTTEQAWTIVLVVFGGAGFFLWAYGLIDDDAPRPSKIVARAMSFCMAVGLVYITICAILTLVG